MSPEYTPEELAGPEDNMLLALFSSEVQLGTPFYRGPVSEIVGEVTAYSERDSEKFGTPDLLNLLRMQYAALGLAGEAGELAGEVKKVLRNDEGVLTDERKAKILDESGDVLWYVEALLSEMGLTLSDAIVNNIEKLRERRASGTIKERTQQEIEPHLKAILGWPEQSHPLRQIARAGADLVAHQPNWYVRVLSAPIGGLTLTQEIARQWVEIAIETGELVESPLVRGMYRINTMLALVNKGGE